MRADPRCRSGFAAAVAASLAAACVQERSALAPAGAGAGRLSALGWPVLLGFGAVSLVMWTLLAYASWRRTGTLGEHAPVDAGGGEAWILLGGFAVPAAVLALVFFATLRTLAAFSLDGGKEGSAFCGPAGAPQIEVVARQWWWEVHYLMGGSERRVTTANEIHVPAGIPVDVDLRSADVIHSFWVPRLQGKVDVIPGRVNRIRLQADRPGVFPGACAELCGMQHAHMGLLVVAEEPPVFERWLEHERADASAPRSEAAARGQALFLGGPCALCHAVRGTPARGSVGPDLTHLAGRRTLAGASLPNDLATLHAWVVDAPALKPGTQMPVLSQLPGPELHELVAYLRELD